VRVVLDTNILVSALMFPGGSPWKVFRLAVDGAIRNAINGFILEELRRTLTVKFRRDESFISDSIELVMASSRIIAPPTSLPNAAVEHADLPVVACALAANAKYLVTGDKGILAAGNYQRTKFISAPKMLAISASRL
jgi:uncharacterized protein